MAFLNVPPQLEDVKKWSRLMAQAINLILQGKTNNTGTATLTANAASTTVTEAPNRIGDGTVILFMPTTANAATAMTNVYVSGRSVANNTFTITHTNNAQTDRIFNYILVG